MKYTIYGDQHGKHEEWQKLILTSNADCHIGIGDCGVGFRKKGGWINTQWLPNNCFWLHGNHDSPAKCVGQKGYLGRYGVIQDFFFVSGAESIDRNHRTPYVDWWPDEELLPHECDAAFEIYKELKPDYVLSHDAPLSICEKLKEAVGGNGFDHIPLKASITRTLLQRMFEFHQPKAHIFCHWHTSFQAKVGNTQFICLNELETYEMEI